jgi:hypothetical protein
LIAGEERQHFPNRYVRMQAGDLELYLDTQFGGVPLTWARGGRSIIENFGGAGFATSWDSGQDPTPASANGPLPNPIARLGDPSSAGFNYYGRETVSDIVDGRPVYQITGFAPMFWLSFEAIDDAIPTYPGSAGHGWATLYHPHGAAADHGGTGTPIYFDGTATEGVGIIFLGDELAPAGLEWNRRLTEIPDGRVAVKTRISLKDAGAGAFAGILFRKDVPQTDGATIHAAYAAPGYALNVNRSGVVQLLRTDRGGATTTVFDQSVPAAATTIQSSIGTQIELRTHNAEPGRIEIWVNDVQVGTYIDPAPILGPHSGLIASATAGRVKFSDRQFFDVGKEYIAKYTGLASGQIELDFTVKNAPFATSRHKLYRASATAFLDVLSSFPQRNVWAIDRLGRRVDAPTDGHALGLIDSGEHDAYSLWAGDAAGVFGLSAVPVLAQINGQPAANPFALLQTVGANNSFVLIVGITPPGTDTTPLTGVESFRLVSLFGSRPQLPPVAVTESNGGTTVSEAGAEDSLSLVLSLPPTAPVEVTFAADGQLQLRKPGGSFGGVQTLQFTTANWNTPQQLFVRAINDAGVENRHVGFITQTTASADARFVRVGENLTRAFGSTPLSVSIEDDDSFALADLIGVVRSDKEWLLNLDDDPFASITFGFGLAGDIPIVGDWDGDGTDNVGVVRAGLGNDGLLRWLFDTDEDATEDRPIVRFGLPGDKPVVGDWDGDGKDDIGVVRGGYEDKLLRWFLDTDLSNNDSDPTHTLVFRYGLDGDTPVVGDWDGNGQIDIGVVRPLPDGSLWWLLDTNMADNETNASHNLELVFGKVGDNPVVGNWDGRGDDRAGIVRKGTDGLLHWVLDLANTPNDPSRELELTYGLNPTDVPVVGRWRLPELTLVGAAGQTVEMGSVALGSTGTTRTITVRNDGDVPLRLGDVGVPAGLVLVDGLPPSLAPGASDSFTVRVDTSVPGERSGRVSFQSSDPDEREVSIALHATVDGTPPRFERLEFVRTTTNGVTTIRGIRLTASEPLRGSVTDRLGAFRLTTVARPRAMRIRTASYDAATRTITLTTQAALTPGQFYQLTVTASTIRDQAGNRLDGDGNGASGDAYIRRVATGTMLAASDSDGDAFRLQATNATLTLVNTASNRILSVELVARNTTPAQLAGSITAAPGDGRVEIGTMVARATFSSSLPAAQFRIGPLAEADIDRLLDLSAGTLAGVLFE